jgi:hypothetical protein
MWLLVAGGLAEWLAEPDYPDWLLYGIMGGVPVVLFL